MEPAPLPWETPACQAAVTVCFVRLHHAVGVYAGSNCGDSIFNDLH